MEGYFPIMEYCKLAQCTRDVAYHRAFRKEVDSFKDKNGTMFIYFTDYMIGIPDGFISAKEYAVKHNVSDTYVRNAVHHNRFNDEDIYILPRHSYALHRFGRIFIRENAQIIKLTPDKRAKLNCPIGYLTSSEWCKKHNITRDRFNQMVIHKRIETIKVGSFRYVKENTELPKDKRRHK